MAERASHREIYQAWKDIYKAMPLIAGFFVETMRNAIRETPGLANVVRKYHHSRKHKELTSTFVESGVSRDEALKKATTTLSDDKYLESSIEKTLDVVADVVNDGLNVAAFSAIDYIGMNRDKRALLEVFRDPVARELGIPPEQVKYKHLKQSNNMIVELAVERHAKNNFWAWSINIPFMGVTALPLMPKAVQDAYTGIFRLKSSSGNATRPIMGVKATYFLNDALTQGKNSTMGVEKVKNLTVDRTSDRIDSRELINDIYNEFVSELKQHRPKYFSDQDDQSKGFMRRQLDKLSRFTRRLSPFHTPPNAAQDIWGIKPLPVTSSDKYSRGVFKLMSEQMRIAMDPENLDDYGKRSQFDIATFTYLTGRGWIDIEHPYNTQLWVRIGAIEGVEGIKRVEDMLEQAQKKHNGKVDHAVLGGLLQNYYTQALASELVRDVGLSPEISLNITRDDGMIENRKIDALVAADVLGAYLTDKLLGGELRVEVPAGQRQLRSEISLTQPQYEEFIKEFEATVRSETRPEYRLRVPREADVQQTLGQLMLDGPFKLGNSDYVIGEATTPKYVTKNIMNLGAVPLADANSPFFGDKEFVTNAATDQQQQEASSRDTIAEEARKYGHTAPSKAQLELLRFTPGDEMALSPAT